MKYFIYTFGCQMNKSDSERIAATLENIGYKKTKNNFEADLIILNTCSVRQSAEDRIFGLLKNLSQRKKKNPKLRIGLTGCMIYFREKALKNKIDFIFDIKNLSKLKKLLTIKNKTKNNTDYFSINPKHQSKFHAYIPIMTGCNNFCTYCVVPYARGREKSRPSKKIIQEVRNLVKKNYKAITLVGQNVNSYGQDLKNEIKFPELLKRVAQIPGDFWIWFITSHPKDMSDKLINIIASEDKICPYIHLPVQAGSNKILKAMNRGYNKERYLELVKKIRKKIKNASLSTDIIVGFPKETKADFHETVDIFKKAKFDMAYIARYSPRPKTAASKLKDNVSLKEKIRRKKYLNKILEKESLVFNKKLIGKKLDVLIEFKIKKSLVGKTKTSKTVKILLTNNYELQTNLIGQIVKVKIIKANNFGVEGRLI